MTRAKKILILGVGSAQSDSIALLRKQGHYVIGVSYKKEGSALDMVNQFEEFDIVDKETILRFAQLNCVDLVYSIGSDLAMPTIGYVNSKLELPSFLTEDLALLSQNKAMFRTFLNRNNFSSIKFKVASKVSDLDDWNTFPAILKPTDNQGQRGVVKVSNQTELNDQFLHSQSYSRTKTVIVEQFIEGKEVSVNGYMFNGELKYSFISDRRVIDGFTGGLVKGHDFPTSMPLERQHETIQLVKQVSLRLNYMNGPIYFQMIHNNEKVFIIEATPRFDGCHLWRLILERYKINLLDLSFKQLLGNEIKFPDVYEPHQRKDSIDFFIQKPGSLFDASHFDNEIKNSKYFEFYYQNDETVRPINGIMEKVGYQIISTDLE